jgi:hypothetical protein
MRSLMIGLTLGTALVLAGQAAVAQEHEHGGGGEHGGGTHPAPHPPEQHAGPTHYQRVTEPKGWNSRPAEVDRGAYQHNFQAARSYKIGPYHRPPGFGPLPICWPTTGCSPSRCRPRAMYGCASVPMRCS